MPGGRPRKPTRLKVVAGTDRPDRLNPNEPIASPDLPTPPAWLSARAAEIFREHVLITDGMLIASASDVSQMALLASRLEEVEICTAVIEDGGRFFVSNVETDDDGKVVAQQIKGHPAVAQRSEAMRHAQSLLAEFGLSPAARGKVSAAKRKEPANGFKELG